MDRKLGAALIVSAILGASSVAFFMPAAPKLITADVHEPAVQQRHSLADFASIQHGMSYDEAARTLGHVGHFGLQGSADAPLTIEAGSKVFTWPNPNGSNIVLIFRHGRLVEKLQFGLN